MILRPLPDGGGTLYRLHLRGTGTWVGTLEVELRATSGGTALTASGITASSTNVTDPTYTPAKAFDGSYATGNGWIADTNGGSNNEYIQSAVATADVVEYVVGAYPNASTASSAVAFRLSRSLDGSTWQVMDVRGNQTGWTANSSRTFTVDQPNVALDLYEESSPTTTLTGSSYTSITQVIIVREAVTLKGARMRSNAASGVHTINLRTGSRTGTVVATGTATGTGDLVVTFTTPYAAAAGTYYLELVSPTAGKALWQSGASYEGWYWRATNVFFSSSSFAGLLPVRLVMAR